MGYSTEFRGDIEDVQYKQVLDALYKYAKSQGDKDRLTLNDMYSYEDRAKVYVNNIINKVQNINGAKVILNNSELSHKELQYRLFDDLMGLIYNKKWDNKKKEANKIFYMYKVAYIINIIFLILAIIGIGIAFLNRDSNMITALILSIPIIIWIFCRNFKLKVTKEDCMYDTYSIFIHFIATIIALVIPILLIIAGMFAPDIDIYYIFDD